MTNRRWVEYGPPNYPFVLNRESPQAKGLVGWWPTLASPGANVLQDWTGKGNNGDFFGDTTGPSWFFGTIRGSVLQFDGNRDYVGMGDPANDSLDMGSASFTLFAWIKTNSATNQVIIWKGGFSGPNAGYMFQVRNTGVLRQLISNGTVVGIATATVGVADDEWHNVVVVVRRAADEVDFYVDGIGETTSLSASISGSIDNSFDFSIGRYATSATFPFNGLISDTRIYNRALTPIEVYQLYAPQTRWELYQPLYRLQLVRVATIISLNTLALASSPQALSVTVDEIVALNELTLVSSAPALTVIAVSTQTVLVQTLILASDTPNLIFAALIVIVFDFNITRAVTFDMGVG